MMLMAKVYEVMTIVYMEACFPQNDLLTKPLMPAYDLLAGGVGGLMVKIILTVILLVIAITAMFKILRQRDAKEDISRMVWVAAILPILILILIIVPTVINAMLFMC